MKHNELIEVRPPKEEDKNFIYSTWLRGNYYGNEFFRQVDAESYYLHYKKVLQHLLSKSDVSVVALKDDPDVILGYSVHEGPTLHWIFLKSAWRGMGISNLLWPKTIQWVTHLTPTAKAILSKKYPGFLFNPFIT